MMYLENAITFNELPQAVSQLIKDVNELKTLLQSVHDNKVETDRWFNIKTTTAPPKSLR